MADANILIVEDTLESLKLLTDLLTAEGYRVRPAQSGELALASLAVRLPDLILLDVRMPGMDGFTVLRRLKALEETRHIPVIILSAITETEQHVEGLQLGAVDFLTKPYRQEELLAKVRTHLELVRMRQTLLLQAEDLRRSNADLEIANRTLAAAKEAAEAASRAKTTFLANVSHELRTPMNGIMGLTEMALSRVSDPAVRKQLTMVIESSTHLLAIISDILDISRLESERLTLEHTAFTAGDVFRHALELVSPQASMKNLPLQIDLPREVADLPLIGDPKRFEQILLNLVGNAIKFTEHGSVDVLVRLSQSTAVDAELRIDISDTGIGTDPKDRFRLFNPFVQSDGSATRKHGGTGLGLAISKRLVEMMGGKIGVESAPGGGSRFWFTVRFLKN